jgi:hypothetical protein
MALTTAGVNGSISWIQTKTNTGFSNTIQGLDSISASVSPSLTGATPANVVYAEERTLSASASQTYDLQSLTDFLSQSLVMTRTYAIAISCSAGQVTLEQGASNPLTWPLSGTAPAMVVPSGGFFVFGQSTAQTVSASVKTLKVTAGGSGGTYKIAILGGQ